MPDLDIVEQKIKPHWRKPYQLIKGGQPDDLCVDALIKALAAELRETQGIPAFEELSAATVARDLSTIAKQIERRFDSPVMKDPVQILERATKRCRAKIDAGLALPHPERLARVHCEELIKHSLLGRLKPTLVGMGRRFSNIESMLRFEARIVRAARPQLEKISRRLAENPKDAKIRAPRSLRKRNSTAELLDTPITPAKG